MTRYWLSKCFVRTWAFSSSSSLTLKKKKKDRKLIIIVTIPLVGAKVPLVYERALFRWCAKFPKSLPQKWGNEFYRFFFEVESAYKTDKNGFRNWMQTLRLKLMLPLWGGILIHRRLTTSLPSPSDFSGIPDTYLEPILNSFLIQ